MGLSPVGQREQIVRDPPTLINKRQVNVRAVLHQSLRRRKETCQRGTTYYLYLPLAWKISYWCFLSCPLPSVQMAFKYLSWLLYPLFGCYAVYSVLYQEHKGWYSFVLGMLYGFLLTFGESLVVIVQKCDIFCQIYIRNSWFSGLGESSFPPSFSMLWWSHR